MGCDSTSEVIYENNKDNDKEKDSKKNNNLENLDSKSIDNFFKDSVISNEDNNNNKEANNEDNNDKDIKKTNKRLHYKESIIIPNQMDK